MIEKQVNPDINLLPKDTGTRVLIEQVCTSKETLILLFEELFGRDQPRELPTKSTYMGKVRTESSNTLKRIDRLNQRGAISAASTNEVSELERIKKIMNDPIEDLVSNIKSYSEIRLKKTTMRGVTTAPPMKRKKQAKQISGQS